MIIFVGFYMYLRNLLHVFYHATTLNEQFKQEKCVIAFAKYMYLCLVFLNIYSLSELFS